MIRLVAIALVFAVTSAAASEECPNALRAGEGAPPLMRPAAGEIQKPYGMVMHPLLMITRMHAGIDFAGNKGQAVVAAADGVVRDAGRSGEYGNLVILDHGAGWQTAYAHLDRIDVAKGACVKRGAQIGGEGSTGLASGPHLHFEVRYNSRPVDPQPLIPAAGP